MDGMTIALIAASFLVGVAFTLMATVRMVSLVIHAFLTVVYYMLQAGQNQQVDTEELVVRGFGRTE